MKRCWFFGDSFTRGDMCYEGNAYYNMTYRVGCKRWTEIVSDYLNMKEENWAWGGNSNLHILYDLIRNVNIFEKDEWVIVGDTRPNRLISFKENGDIRNQINDPHFGYKKGDDIILDYILKEIIPNEKYYQSYYETMFLEILKSLEKRGVNTLFWKHTDFWYPSSKLESIQQHTNYKIKDLHYSWNAHAKKAEIIISRINKDTKKIL